MRMRMQSSAATATTHFYRYCCYGYRYGYGYGDCWPVLLYHAFKDFSRTIKLLSFAFAHSSLFPFFSSSWSEHTSFKMSMSMPLGHDRIRI